MHLSLDHLFVLLERYTYIAIFPISIVEGPIITVIAGFIASLGYIHILVALPILVLGDLAGDALHYAIGRYSSDVTWMHKLGRFFGYTDTHHARLEAGFKAHKIKSIFLGKLAHGVGGAVLVVAGVMRMNFFEFLWLNLLATTPKTFLLLLIGFYLGSSYTHIDKYLGYIALGTITLAAAGIVLYVVVGRIAQKKLA